MLIRPAEVKDAVFAVQMIHASMGLMADQMFGFGNRDLAVEKLTWFFCHPENQFSFTNAEILEWEGKPAGLLLAMTGKELERLVAPMFRQVISVYGFAGMLRVLWRTLPVVFEKEAEKDEFYISNLAVHTDFRRMGLAKNLLEHAEGKARKLGLEKCSLLVEIGNTAAKTLYLRTGYRVVGVSANALMQPLLSTPGSERMVKNLPPVSIHS